MTMQSRDLPLAFRDNRRFCFARSGSAAIRSAIALVLLAPIVFLGGCAAEGSRQSNSVKSDARVKIARIQRDLPDMFDGLVSATFAALNQIDSFDSDSVRLRYIEFEVSDRIETLVRAGLQLRIEQQWLETEDSLLDNPWFWHGVNSRNKPADVERSIKSATKSQTSEFAIEILRRSKDGTNSADDYGAVLFALLVRNVGEFDARRTLNILNARSESEAPSQP